MKVVIQRVSSASVSVAGEVVGKIEQGILALVGLALEDKEEDLKRYAEKLANLRIFSDEQGRFNFSLLDIQGDLLLVPQFTLLADTSKGRRPEFFQAMPPEQAKIYFEKFSSICSQIITKPIQAGVFGADMKVSLVNDGPVTIIL
jgi:D-tyrosyl-tRNA(Tyr) deacylase